MNMKKDGISHQVENGELLQIILQKTKTTALMDYQTGIGRLRRSIVTVHGLLSTAAIYTKIVSITTTMCA